MSNKLSILIISGGVFLSGFAYAGGVGFVISNYSALQPDMALNITNPTLIGKMSKNPVKPGEYSYTTTQIMNPGDVIGTGTHVLSTNTFYAVTTQEVVNYSCTFKGPAPATWSPYFTIPTCWQDYNPSNIPLSTQCPANTIILCTYVNQTTNAI